MKKRIMIIIFAFLIVLPFGVSQANAAATSGKCGNNLTWTYNQGVLTISGTGPMWTYPELGYDWPECGAPWAIYAEKVTKIIIGEGVTTVSEGAFCNFVHNKEVTLPSTLTSIGNDAFWYNPAMKRVTIPASVKSIGNWAFGLDYFCEGGVAPVKGYTICGYRGTEAERYYKDLLADYTWWNNWWMDTVANPVNDPYADNFGPNGAVYFVDLGKHNVEATSGRCGDNATWSYNKSNGTLTISGTGPMWDYTETLKLSDDFEPELSSKAPGWYAFQDSIKQIIVTSGVTHIGDHAFQAEPDMDWVGDGYPPYNGFRKLTTVKLADTVSTIGTGAFAHCNALSSIDFGNGLTKIGDYAFSVCEGLKRVSLPSSLTSVGANAFRGTALTSVTIPKSVKSIGSEAFGYSGWETDYGFLPVNGFTIYGQAGSAAETYYKTLLNKYNKCKRDTYLVKYYPEAFGPNGTVYFIKTITGFNDVFENDWFADDVKYVVDKKLMNGTGNDMFSPNGKTTRGQAVTILYRLAGSPSASGNSFSDIKSSDWYYKAAEWASKNGIASGYGNGKFGPNDTLNREQLATMLYRYAQFKKMNTTTSGGLSKFSDSGSVSGYALDAMSWAVSKGLISGTSDGKLTPGATATRAQLAAILHRFGTNVK